MATTQTASPAAIVRGLQGATGELYVLEIPVLVNGTYLTASKPNFNVLTALQNAKMGVSAVNVKSVVLLRDYYDGTTRYTAPNASIALTSVNSGCTNDKVTFPVHTTDSTHRNGQSNAEISDSTALNHYFVFLVVAEITSAQF